MLKLVFSFFIYLVLVPTYSQENQYSFTNSRQEIKDFSGEFHTDSIAIDVKGISSQTEIIL